MIRIEIPTELKILHPNLTRQELRAVVMTFIKSKNNKLRQSRVFKINMPNIGILQTHPNKKPIGLKKLMERDRKRKREQLLKKKKDLNNLLF